MTEQSIRDDLRDELLIDKQAYDRKLALWRKMDVDGNIPDRVQTIGQFICDCCEDNN